MARIRTVKPDMFGSFSMAEVPIEARYLFVGLFTEADDEGLMLDSPKRLAGAIFPHDEKVTAQKIDGWLDDLARVGCLVRYIAGEGRYLCIPKWLDHQKISHPTPSKLPYPSGVFPEKNGKTQEWLRESPEDFAPEREREREQGSLSAESPLTPIVDGGTDASQPKQKLNPRAAGTNPRAAAAALVPGLALEAERDAARSYGHARRSQGVHADVNEAMDEFRSRWPNRNDLQTIAVQAWVDNAAAVPA
jgi:hypothetical protein